MIELRQTETFARWFDGLRDRDAKARIAIRLRRLSLGNAGDVKPVGDGISELRIDYGPGYRVYYSQRGPVLVLLLCGGDKRTQKQDIATAKALAAENEE
ncbi:type II toxin-antitoxin system RelE/ParE family toxin [Oceanibaculum pacificum]|uniref:Addiction module antitoxin RelB n=1 Tax=Oceanibaculum pacificum TaxID=580166 RepID=A0A154VUH3_9PROT|nr:type II toxin-antitoxin system RelE/ParE family toxin [Oceanibaculum pacificum]KZD04916.1 addiction module antitoxin RelB [Oceanibaculum pacificum]